MNRIMPVPWPLSPIERRGFTQEYEFTIGIVVYVDL